MLDLGPNLELLAVPDDTRRAVAALVAQYRLHRAQYQQAAYKEAHIRGEFIDPLFEALGWDVRNRQGNAPQYREVIAEDTVEVEGGKRAPDYCFRHGREPVFYVEAKAPSINIREAASPAYQVRRYGWSARLPLCILTDFEEFAVYDCRRKPSPADKSAVARVGYLTFEQYDDELPALYSVFAREAIPKGFFDRFAESTRGKRGTQTVDAEFLKEIETWRDELARNLALRNADLSVHDLNFAVQALVDRLLFLRMAEDRKLEPYEQLRHAADLKAVYPAICDLFRRADDKYNSGLFDFKRDTLTCRLALDNKVLKGIIGRLYYPDCPYEFSVLGADILGAVYEQFLGKIIRLTAGHQAKVEEKPEVKKAGGVYYTPAYIVDYIVKHTVGEALNGPSPPAPLPGGEGRKATAAPSGRAVPSPSPFPPLPLGEGPGVRVPLRILDPACGSGSFLLGAYDYLLNWHLEHYLAQDPAKLSKGKSPVLAPDAQGGYRLSTAERKRLLLEHIFGVDIDPQAVEVAKLNLLLKCLEGETEASLQGQLLRERALPNIDGNIKCGNSLIGPDYFTGRLVEDEDEYRRVNPFDWQAQFPAIMKSGGFDCVIGNPPYLKIEHIVEADRVYLSSAFRSFMGRYDTYGAFVEKSVGLLRTTGRFGMIIPSTLLNNRSFRQLRRLLLEATAIDRFVNLGGGVFEGATNDVLILLFSVGPIAGRPTEILDVQEYGKSLSAARSLGTKDLPATAKPPDFIFELRMSAGADAILQRMTQTGVSLDELCSVFQGFVTGGNEAYIVDDTTIAEEGLERSVCELAVFGDEVPRYGVPTPRSWVLYLTKATRLENYPHAAARLAPFRERLQQKREVKLGRQPWYCLHWPRVQANFELPEKILVGAIRNLSLKRRVVATLDTEKLYADHTLNVVYMKANNYHVGYILGILNSALVNYLFRVKYIDINIKGAYLKMVPIRPIDFSDPADVARHERMVGLVQAMLDLNRRLPAAQTPRDRELLERRIADTDRAIDALVYELYALTAEEIAIVEGEA